MPTIRVDGPKITDLDKKRKLVKKLTDVASEIYGIDKERFVIILRENEPENVGVGGELLIDRLKER